MKRCNVRTTTVMPKKLPLVQTQALKRWSHGFSLIEVAVVLAVTAVIGLAIWKLLPAVRGATTEDSPQQQILDAQQALEGFVLLKHRLPCPDTNDDGEEDCGGVSSAGALPYKTLALAKNMGIRYGAFRNASVTLTSDADLVVTKVRYAPPVPPTPAATAFVASGLDFCIGLKNAIAISPAGVVTSGAVPVAYALVHPGADKQIDVVNSTTSFATGNAPRSASYDDRVLTSGLSEMFGRLNCPERLGQANGAARAVYAAYDIDREAEFHQRFRNFDVRVQKQLLEMAKVNLAIAITDGVIAGAATVIAIAAAFDTTGLSLVLSAVAIPLAVAEAAFNIVSATMGLADAEQAVTDAEANYVAATAFRTGTAALYSNARAEARANRLKGLLI